MRREFKRFLAFASAIAVFSTPALADAIDGEWCHQAKSLKIEGPSIRTIGGTTITGDYSRHGFRYTVPTNEAEAGTLIVMVLRGEEAMELTRVKNGVEGERERWVRCRPVS